MIYLTRMLGKPVVDAAGDEIGTISDIAIATGEVFPASPRSRSAGPTRRRSCCRGASTSRSSTTIGSR
jgi:magnesium transporter